MKYIIRVYTPYLPPPNRGFKLVQSNIPYWESGKNSAEDAVEIIGILDKQNISCEVSPSSPYEDSSIVDRVVKKLEIKVIPPKK